MQIIEVTDIAGVRSAVHTFGRPSTPLQFVVFPMVHLAEAGFYEQVAARLKGCDLVVAEGVTSGSGRAEPRRHRVWSSIRLSALTGTYRWLKLGGRFGLVLQNIDGDRTASTPRARRPTAAVSSSLGVPVVNPDVSVAEFGRLWRQSVSRLMSVAVWMLIPLYTIGTWLFGTRRLIGRNLAMDDIPAAKDVLVSDRLQDMIDVVGKQRDRPLLKALASIHQERCEEPIRVAVVYGAAHVPAVVTGLHALGYRHCSAEWLTVFTVDS